MIVMAMKEFCANNLATITIMIVFLLFMKGGKQTGRFHFNPPVTLTALRTTSHFSEKSIYLHKLWDFCRR